MICQRCLRASSRLARPSPLLSPHSLAFSTTSSARSTPTQPLSTPSTTSPSLSPAAPTPTPTIAEISAKPAAAVVTLSSVPAGTPLKGLNFLKNAQDPVALEDSEYPAWLWGILRKGESKGEGAGEGDLFSKSKKQRRLAAKRLRKAELRDPDALAPKVPLYEQSIDLPAGNGTVQGAVQAAVAREELKKAMRVKRRADIKEGNFLKTMG